MCVCVLGVYDSYTPVSCVRSTNTALYVLSCYNSGHLSQMMLSRPETSNYSPQTLYKYLSLSLIHASGTIQYSSLLTVVERNLIVYSMNCYRSRDALPINSNIYILPGKHILFKRTIDTLLCNHIIILQKGRPYLTTTADSSC